MNSPNWKSVADVLGTIAIVGSLVFVGLEIKQSRDIAVADVYQQQAALLATIQINYESPEDFYEARRKYNSGEELSENDVEALTYSHNPWMTYYENIHFQNSAGLLSEEHWNSIEHDIRERVRQDMYFLRYWETVRDSWRPSFVEVVDRVIQEEATD